MEKRFGAIVDATLTREGVVTTEDSRWSVIEAVARDLTKGAEKLARNADGDYTPDTYANRFPPKPGKSLAGLADAWHAAALARGVRPRDAKRWRAVVLRFKKWLGHDDLNRITMERVQAWGTSAAPLASRPRQSMTPTSQH